MRKIVATAVLVVIAPALSVAQDASPRNWTQGYVFFSPAAVGTSIAGARPSVLGFGFGSEARLRGGVGVGVDLAGETPTSVLVGGFGHEETGLGLGSLDFSYHPSAAATKADPFVNFGYTLYFGHRTASGYNFGGGVSIWFAKHFAFRPEVRYYGGDGSFPNPVPGVSGMLTFRLGLAFR